MGSRSSGSSERTDCCSVAPAVSVVVIVVVAGSSGRRRQRRGGRGGSPVDRFGGRAYRIQTPVTPERGHPPAKVSRQFRATPPARHGCHSFHSFHSLNGHHGRLIHVGVSRPPRPPRPLASSSSSETLQPRASPCASTKPSWRIHRLLRRGHRDHQYDQLGRHAENPRVPRGCVPERDNELHYKENERSAGCTRNGQWVLDSPP